MFKIIGVGRRHGIIELSVVLRPCDLELAVGGAFEKPPVAIRLQIQSSYKGRVILGVEIL